MCIDTKFIGAKGMKGDLGVRGTQGPPGAVGRDGPPGTAGARGPLGKLIYVCHWAPLRVSEL